MLPSTILAASEVLPKLEPKKQELAPFNPLQVELLLNQSADILERAWTELKYHNELRTQYKQFFIDLENEELEIREAEDKLFSDAKDTPEFEGRKLINDPPDPTPANWLLRQAMVAEHTGLLDLRPNAVEARDHAEHVRRERSGTEQVRADVDVDLQRVALKKYDADIAAVRCRHNAELMAARFRKKMHERAKVALLEKRTCAQDGNEFDFLGQSNMVLRLLGRDRQDAHARLMQAARGLRHLYGKPYSDWLRMVLDADKVERFLSDPSGTDSIEDLLIWTRTAIAFLAAFGQRDQAFTLVVSLRDALKEIPWKEWIAGDCPSISFPISTTLVPGHSFVRLRGISATIIARKRELQPWQMTFVAPAEFVPLKEGVERLSASAVIGRVDTQDAVRSPDLVGMLTLYNVTPFDNPVRAAENTRWNLTLNRPSRAALAYKDLEDINIELAIVGQPV